MPRLGQQRRTGRITDELTSGTEAVTEARKPRRRVFAVIAGALVLCSGLVAVALAASTNFVEPATSPEPVGDAPFAVAAGDLDGDDDQDLAVANQNSDNVTILKNDGAGHFSQPVSSPEAVGDAPRSVAVADLDGDDDQDLAVANASSANVTILRNNGSGNFGQPASSPESAGSGPSSVAATDLDGDSDPDLAVANAGSGDVTILRNVGAGDFTQPASSPEDAENSAFAVAAANLDGDTDQDLAVANLGGGNVTILRNNGSGNFNEPATSPEPAGSFAGSIAAADFDGDTDQDLAVGISVDLTILRNNGAGNFAEPGFSPLPTGNSPIAVAAADFDLDGDPDLAVANNGTDDVTILRNNGSGRFGEPATSPEAVGDNPRSVAVADLDGDADQDLAVANAAVDSATILRNR